MPLLLPGQFALHLAMLERFVMPLYVSSYYPAIFSQNCHKFNTSLEYVGILCQEERSGRAYHGKLQVVPSRQALSHECLLFVDVQIDVEKVNLISSIHDQFLAVHLIK